MRIDQEPVKYHRLTRTTVKKVDYNRPPSTDVVYSTAPWRPMGVVQSDIRKSDFITPTSYTSVYYKQKPGKLKHVIRTVTGSLYDGTLTITGSFALNPMLNYSFANFATCSVAGPEKGYDSVIIEALNRAADVNWDALTTLAESRETASTLVTLVRTGLELVRAAKRLDLKRLRKACKQASKRRDLPARFRKKAKRASYNKGAAISSASEAWLTYRYGITPTLMDIQSIRKLLDEGIKTPMTRTIRAGRSYDKNKKYETKLSGYKIRKMDVQRQVTERCMLTLSVKSPKWATGSAFGVTSPMSTVWEIIPFSFVVDWFLPIGDWIRAMSVVPNVNFVRGSVSIANKANIGITIENQYQRSDNHYVATCSHRVTSYSRSKLSRIPPAMPFTLKKAPFEGLVGAKRATDVLAFLSQVAKEKPLRNVNALSGRPVRS